MGTTTGRSVLYGDVALIGVGVFLAVAMVLAALGGPAAATSPSTPGALAAADADTDHGGAGAGGSTDASSEGSAAEPSAGSGESHANGATAEHAHEGGDEDHDHAHDDGGAHAQDGTRVAPAPRRPASSGSPARTAATSTGSASHGHGHDHAAGSDDGHAAGTDDHHEDDHGTAQAGHHDEHEQEPGRGAEHGHDDTDHHGGDGDDGHDGGDPDGDDGHGHGSEGDGHGHGEQDEAGELELTGLVPVPGMADEDDGHGHDDGGHGEDSHPSGSHGDHAAGCDENHPAAQKLLAEVQNSLDTTYKNVAAMIAQGFIPYFDAQIPLGLATEGTGHWLNPDYIDNGVQLDAYRPEGILTDQFHNPIGIMFIADADGYEKPVYVNEDGTECSPWHPHTDTPATFSWWFYEMVFDGKWMEGDVEWQPVTPAMLHVWSVHNPHGVFAAHDYPEVEDRPGLSLERQAPLPAPAPFGEVLPTIDEQLGPLNEATCPHC